MGRARLLISVIICGVCACCTGSLWHTDREYAITFAVCGVIMFGLIGDALMVGDRTPEQSTLDRPLFSWNKENVCTLRDILNGGLAIFGRTGSGKSSSSGKKIAEALVSVPNSGGLVLLPKVRELNFWKKIFASMKRTKDMLVFGPKQLLRFNLLDYELKHGGGHTRSIVRLLMTVSDVLRGSDSDGREQDKFWELSSDRLLCSAVEILIQATGSVNAPDLQRFINGAAMSATEVKDAEWRKGFHAQLLLAGDKKVKSEMQKHDWEQASSYWLIEYPGMADKTRSSILAGVMNTLGIMNTGVVRELFSTTTNVTPDDILAGKWLVVDAPPAEHGDVGAFINACWKYSLQRAILRRTATETTSPVVIFCDEAHLFINQYDAPFLATCRSHKGCMIFLNQALSSVTAAMRGQNPEEKAKALLSQFSTKLFHAVDEHTAAWAVEMVGRTVKTYVNPSFSSPEYAYDEIFRTSQGQVSMSTTKHMENDLETTAFQHGLRTGGPPSYCADAYVIRNGIPFRNGKPFIRVTFQQ